MNSTGLNHDDASQKQPEKVPSSFLKYKSKNIVISGVIFVALLFLVIFLQTPQTIIQRAATGNQATNSCSPVPFYCLILGGGKTCTQPPVCPTPPPAKGFVPQSNPVKVATGSATTASGSGQICNTAPAVLTDKLTVHFDFAQTAILAADKPTLNNYATALKKYPTATVTLAGYTDSVPFQSGTGTNQVLSQQRAQAVETYLKSQGATTNTYVVNGYGAANPVAPNAKPNGADNPAGRAQNRRVEITSNVGKAKTCTATNVTQPVCTPGGNWSGYLSTKLPANASQTSIETDWTVSSVSCPGGKPYGISQWPGIEGGTGNNHWLAQLGSYSACPQGNTNYFAWAIIFGRDKVFTGLPKNKYPVKPGDQFSASLNMTKVGTIMSVMTNHTQKWSYSRTMTISNPGSVLDSEIILENEGYPSLPLANFTDATFSGDMFSLNNGSTQSFNNAPSFTCRYLNEAANIKQDDISNFTNASFDAKWLHN